MPTAINLYRNNTLSYSLTCLLKLDLEYQAVVVRHCVGS